jgi:DNA-binding MarR family transcriptional regulator
MEYKIQKLYDQVNQAIIRCRGVYSMWAKNNNVSYNRMLVLYTIREFGFCTQKQICDSYLLPRQTVNHVISEMKKDGILVVDPEKSTGKEKALVLTPEGKIIIFVKPDGRAGGETSGRGQDPQNDGTVYGV